ncbi:MULTISPECIES: hypothetical protein [unclassified Microbacterium]|uniref:hypothetical protein n=1 Tax=unclassified Microbacterium TaxID=2609290 RepID=UPI00386D9F14
MTTTRRALVLSIALVTGILSCTGCVAGQDDAFTAPASGADVLPSSTEEVLPGIAEDTVRFLGEDSVGWRYFAAKAAVDGERDKTCLVIDALTPRPTVACGPDELPGEVAIGDVAVTVTDGTAAVAGTGEQVGDYLFVQR